jgi:hypothetical protein
MAIIVFVVIALVSLVFTYGIYMVAAILNVAAVVVGPVFLALAAVPITRRYAHPRTTSHRPPPRVLHVPRRRPLRA